MRHLALQHPYDIKTGYATGPLTDFVPCETRISTQTLGTTTRLDVETIYTVSLSPAVVFILVVGRTTREQGGQLAWQEEASLGLPAPTFSRSDQASDIRYNVGQT